MQALLFLLAFGGSLFAAYYFGRAAEALDQWIEKLEQRAKERK